MRPRSVSDWRISIFPNGPRVDLPGAWQKGRHVTLGRCRTGKSTAVAIAGRDRQEFLLRRCSYASRWIAVGIARRCVARSQLSFAPRPHILVTDVLVSF